MELIAYLMYDLSHDAIAMMHTYPALVRIYSSGPKFAKSARRIELALNKPARNDTYIHRPGS